jgi:hypothetical protein
MKLIALRCPNCTNPLAVENDDVVVACHNCQIMVAISENGPARMPVRFVVPAGQPQQPGVWSPFWVFNGRVHIKQRETQGRASGEKDSRQLWGSPRALYVPAWDLSMHTAQNVGSYLIQQQPALQEIERPSELQFTSATVTPGDARKLLEFIVLAIEARRDDMLKNLQFNLEIGEPQMTALPKRMIDSA